MLWMTSRLKQRGGGRTARSGSGRGRTRTRTRITYFNHNNYLHTTAFTRNAAHRATKLTANTTVFATSISKCSARREKSHLSLFLFITTKRFSPNNNNKRSRYYETTKNGESSTACVCRRSRRRRTRSWSSAAAARCPKRSSVSSRVR